MLFHRFALGVLRDAAGEGEGGGGAAEQQPDPKTLQAEIDRLRNEATALKAQTAEQEQAIRYWHEAATEGGKKEPAPKQDTPADGEEDLLEVVTRSGAKGLKEVLKKHGFVESSEVDQRIESRAQQIATENELAARYPELKDNKSEFFQATAKEYKVLTDSGVPQALAMKLAAERAELQGYQSGKRLTAAEKEEREARARAQGGGKEKKAAAAPEEDNDELDAEQKYICEAMGVDPEAYKKRAKAGIVYQGGK